MKGWLFIVVLGLYIYVLVDLARSPREQVRTMPKTLWALVILVLGLIGMAMWFLFGRPRVGYPPPGYGGGSPGGSGSGPRPGQPLAPDDDPAFLRRLDEATWRARMEQLRRERQSRGGAEGNGGEPPESTQT